MKNLILYILMALALILNQGCSKDVPVYYTPSFIVKDANVSYYDRMENTPFIWTDGRQLTMVSAYALNKIEIYDGLNKIAEHSTNVHLASAIVIGTKLYVFGTTGNGISYITTDDFITWTSPVLSLPSVPNRTYFNNSIIQLPDSSFLMAYETCEPNTVCFNVRFVSSPDLVTWTEVGDIYSPDAYAACPTIRYVNGEYYMFYLKNTRINNFATFVTKSSDLINWSESKVVLSADDYPEEGSNNSDMDLVEYNGQVIMSYAIGNQTTWDHIKYARYNGTLEQFLGEFFQ